MVYVNEKYHNIASARARGEVKLINRFSYSLQATESRVKEGLSGATLYTQTLLFHGLLIKPDNTYCPWSQ